MKEDVWYQLGFDATIEAYRKGLSMPSSEEISVTMPPDLIRMLRETVEAGEFASTSDALRDAVRVWHERRQDVAERLADIRERVQRSLDDPRPSLSADEAEAQMNLFMGARRKAFRNAAG